MSDRDNAMSSLMRDGATIDAVFHDFHAVDGAGFQIGQHRLPVVRRPIRHVQHDGSRGRGIRC